jgi:hypothetical protein
MTKSKRRSTVDSAAVELTDEDFAPREQILDDLYMFGHLCDVENPECRPWMETIIAIDHGGDFQLLLDMLQSGRSVPSAVMPYLEDLFARRKLLKDNRKSKKSGPLYEPNFHHMLISFAVDDVKCRPKKMTLDEAIAIAAKRHGLMVEVVRAACEGRHSSFRRWLKKNGPH